MIADANKLTLVPVRHSADPEVAGFVDELLRCAALARLRCSTFPRLASRSSALIYRL